MTDFEKQAICDGVHFSSIHDDRFKTGRISATVLLPLGADTAAANSILPYILRRSCRAYPDFTALNKKLGELYGAGLSADVRKIGEAQALTVSAVGIDDRYSLDGQSISAQLAELLCSVLFAPALLQGSFRSEDIEQERRQLIEQIDSEYNDKRAYAKLRCEQLMCANEAFGVNRYGTREQVEKLTAQDVFDAWQRMLKNARVELMMLGSSDPDGAFRGFEKAFGQIKRGNVADCKTEVVRSAQKTADHNDTMDVAQAKLVLGMRAGTAVPDEDVMAARLMTALYGGTPHSKLFLNVREKLSLCYYCSARYDRNKGIILVESGVEQRNIEKAREEIIRQLSEIQAGKVNDDEMSATKMSIANSFRSVSDHLAGLEAWYINQIFDDQVQTPQECVQAVNAVTRDEVIAAAKKVTLDTVYTLTAKEEARA